MNFQKMVREFHEKMTEIGARSKHPEIYVPLDRHTAQLRARLILEEAKEFESAAELIEIGYPRTEKRDRETQIEMIDAICDLLYVTFGAAVAMGLEIDPFFELVHEANMRKFMGDAYLRDDGKWVKPTGWEKPDLESLLNQIEEDELGNGEHR